MNSLTDVLGQIAGYIWGVPLVVALVGVGVFFTFRLFFFQTRKIGHSFAIIRGKYDDPNDKGDVTHFQALCAALSATVGVGNIAGVATAIHAGGPGILFWMWVAAFFGMMTKYAECLLSHKYRVVHDDGTVSGGPMYYIEKGLGKRYKWLAVTFAFCAIIGTFGGGNMVQSNSMAIALEDNFIQKLKPETSLGLLNKGESVRFVDGPEIHIETKSSLILNVELSGCKFIQDFLDAINNHPKNYKHSVTAAIMPDHHRIEIVDNTSGDRKFAINELKESNFLRAMGFFNEEDKINMIKGSRVSTVVRKILLLRIIVGFVISGIVGIVIIGGMKRIGKVASKLVPTMAGIYVGGALLILIINISSVPHAFYLIFKHAFNPTAAVGGFGGAAVLYTITWGIKRAVFSNEAGMGSAPIAHAAAKTKEPVREGLVAMVGPFIDTLVICTITALVIIVTGAWETGANSSVLTKNAFNIGLKGFGGVIVTVGLVLFSISTAISWSYYGDRCSEYLFGEKAILPYRCVFILALFVGAVIELTFVWNFSDIGFGCMIIPNIIGIVALSGVVITLTKKYFSEKQIRSN